MTSDLGSFLLGLREWKRQDLDRCLLEDIVRRGRSQRVAVTKEPFQGTLPHVKAHKNLHQLLIKLFEGSA
jgi:hypothetical protein